MITSDDLALLDIRRVIFHDVPRKIRGSDCAPVLSDVECKIDDVKLGHLRKKLIAALSSRAAYDVAFRPESASSVPSIIRGYTASNNESGIFVQASRSLAGALHDNQTGSSSAGLLAVLGCIIGTDSTLAILKLEREEGAQIQPIGLQGQRTFDIAILDNLVLTAGTKLFKTALFRRIGPGDQDFSAVACDNQRTVGASAELAQFWQAFLGCQLTEEPRVATKRFFEAALQYANSIDDPIQKNTIFEHVVSQMKSQRANFSPRLFAEEYLAEEHRVAFMKSLQAQNISMKQFPLDTSEIAGQLRRKSMTTARGVTVIVPADADGVVDIQSGMIVIKEPVQKVAGK